MGLCQQKCHFLMLKHASSCQWQDRACAIHYQMHVFDVKCIYSVFICHSDSAHLQGRCHSVKQVPSCLCCYAPFSSNCCRWGRLKYPCSRYFMKIKAPWSGSSVIWNWSYFPSSAPLVAYLNSEGESWYSGMKINVSVTRPWVWLFRMCQILHPWLWKRHHSSRFSSRWLLREAANHRSGSTF